MVRRFSTEKTTVLRKDGSTGKRMTFVLPLELTKELAHRAIDENRPMAEIVADAIGEHLKRKPRK